MILAQAVDDITKLMPTEGQGAWMWLAALVVPAFGWFVFRYIKRLEAENETLSTELSKTTDSLKGMNDVAEKQRQAFTDGFAEMRRDYSARFDRVEQQMREVLDAAAPRTRGGS